MPSRSTLAPWTGALALVILAWLLRLPALDMPLNRDEAVYAVIGDQGGPGLLPYRDLFDHKQPLVYPVYWALAQLAPLKLGAIRLAAALAGGLAGAALFLALRRRIGGPRAGAAAAMAVLVGTSTFVEGYDLNTEHLLVLTGSAAVLGALALERSPDRRVPMAVGLLAGLAVCTKAVFALTVPVLLIPLLAGRAARGLAPAGTVARFAAAAAAVPLLAFAGFAAAGAAGDFWAANVTYNRAYVEASPGPLAFPGRLGPIWALCAAALVAGAVRLVRAGGRDVLAWTLLGWLVAAFVGAKLSGYNFPHYYAPCVPPAVALLWLPGARGRRWTSLAATAVAIALAVPFARSVGLAFGETGAELSARQYGAGYAGVWGMQHAVGRMLAGRARPGDRLFVAGAEPGFYWTSRLRPATRYLYDYTRGFRSDWSAEIRRGVCERPPRFVILSEPAYPVACLDLGLYEQLLVAGRPEATVTVLERR